MGGGNEGSVHAWGCFQGSVETELLAFSQGFGLGVFGLGRAKGRQAGGSGAQARGGAGSARRMARLWAGKVWSGAETAPELV